MDPKSQSQISKARRERERDEMTARIKDIAREMFVRDGYEAVTLQKIAAKLEYTRPSLYRYFKDKKELLCAIVLEDMQDLHGQVLECASMEDPVEQLMEMARRYAVWAVTHPNHYLLFYSRGWTEQEDAVRQEVGVPREQEPLFLLYRAVERLVEEGMLKQKYNDAPLIARTLLAAVHGVVMLEITMSNYDKSLIQDKGRPFPQCLETILGGLASGFLKESEA